MYISEPWLKFKSFQDTGHTVYDHLTPNKPCYHTNCLVSDGDSLMATAGIYSHRSGGLWSASLKLTVNPQPPPALTRSQHCVWLPEPQALSTSLFSGRSSLVAFTGTSSDLQLPMPDGPPSSVRGLLLFLKCMHFLATLNKGPNVYLQLRTLSIPHCAWHWHLHTNWHLKPNLTQTKLLVRPISANK